MSPIRFTILDCETTGLNPEYGDQIIEIALIACTLHNGKLVEIDRFESLVNPGVRLDEKITFITGIKNEDLEHAPKIVEVKEKILTFFEKEPIIVGHNVAFDINYLKHSGLFGSPPDSPVPAKEKKEKKNAGQLSLLDTSQPQTESSESVTWDKSLDTLDLAFLFEESGLSLSLESLTGRYDIEHNSHRAMGDVEATLKLLQIYVDKIISLPNEVRPLVEAILSQSEWSGKVFLPSEKSQDLNTLLNGVILSLSSQAKDPGPSPQDKAQDISFHSPEKEKLYNLISDQLNQGKRAIINLSPASGKTFVGLKAALDFATEKNERVLYLYPFFNKDIEECIALFQNTTGAIVQYQDPKYILSIHKFYSFVTSKESYTKDETLFILKLLLWLPSTKTGNLREIYFPGSLRFYSALVTGADVADSKMQEVFATNHVATYANAKVVLSNFYEFFTAPEHNPLSDFRYLILEGGATLEESLLYANTTVLNPNRLNALVESLEKVVSQDAAEDSTMNEHVKELKERTPFFLGFLGMFAEKRLQENSSELLLDAKSTTHHDFEKAKYTATDLREHLLAVQPLLSNNPKYADLATESQRVQDVLGHMITISPETPCYVELRNGTDVILKQTYLPIESFFQQKLAPAKAVIIFSSTTTDIAAKLDLKDYKILEHTATFTTPLTTYLVEDMKAAYGAAQGLLLQEIVGRIVGKKQNGIIFILSSLHLIEQVVINLAPAWKEAGIPFLAQKMSGGERKVMEKYEQSGFQTLLFCTADFFNKMNPRKIEAGVFFVQKLPFAYTGGLIDGYRKSKVRSEFMDYALPKSLLRFEGLMGQMKKVPVAGKKLFILDSKIVTEEYGKRFQELLPQKEETYIIGKEEIVGLL